MCLFVRYTTQETSDFEGNRKSKETYPKFRGKVVALSNLSARLRVSWVKVRRQDGRNTKVFSTSM